MEKEKWLEIESMLTVLHKKAHDNEEHIFGSTGVTSISSYYEDLKSEAEKVQRALASVNNSF